ncbi:MAG TPA: hypothetical protein VIH42_08025, partial [Thermoguttaceae bacterium]
MSLDNTTTTSPCEAELLAQEKRRELPLFVDLDGTLVKSDLLVESLLIRHWLVATRKGLSQESN